jgi:hypothetical protein
MAMAAGLLALSACGGERDMQAAGAPQSASTGPPGATPTTTLAGGGENREGTKLIVDDSEFGTMLFDSRTQAIYLFERDGIGRSVC